MGMTRTEWELAQHKRSVVLAALRDNPLDEFSASDLFDSLSDPEITTSREVGAALTTALDEGLVTKRPNGNHSLWRITTDGLAWQPQPYDWRRGTTPKQKPTSSHPWKAKAVTPKAEKQRITRPLPHHLESVSMSPTIAVPTTATLDPIDMDLADALKASMAPSLAHADLRMEPTLEAVMPPLKPAHTHTCTGHCHTTPSQAAALADYLALLLAIADQNHSLVANPVWQAARSLESYFGLVRE